MNRKATIRTGTIIAGILTALVIVVSQLFYFEKANFVKKEVKTEQSTTPADSASDHAYITLPSSTLPSSTHVEFSLDPFCLFEVGSQEVEEPAYDFSNALPVNKFLKTLFGAIISPNAP